MKQLESVVVGQGLAGVTVQDAIFQDGSRLIWRAYRDQIDDLGMRHVFSRQVLVPGPALARALGEPYATDGIPVLGGEIGIHTAPDGDLNAVFGRQLRDVSIASVPAITRPEDALRIAFDALSRRADFAAPEWATWSTLEIAAQEAQTRLVLRAVAGESVHLVWEVPIQDRADMPYTALLDADTGDLLHVDAGVSLPVCAPPASPPIDAAVIVAQNSSPGISRGWTSASLGSDRPGWSHEGHLPAIIHQLPEIDVYKHWNLNDPNACAGKEWALLALNRRAPARPSDPPQYADSTAQGAGSSAGDALWNTTLIMTTLKQWYGWCGYDGSCRFRANIVFDRPEHDKFGYAYFSKDVNDLLVPLKVPDGHSGHAVVVAQPLQQVAPPTTPLAYPYSASASLDVMGHEWGHAVNWEANQQFGSSPVPQGPQLDEGFANVLGHGVEWLNRPAGRGYEKADWCFGEDHYNGSWAPNTDCPLFWSRADWFVEKVRTPNWQAMYPGTDYGSWYAYHRDQFTLPWPELPRYAVGDGHVQGHMLSVVLYLLSQGGKNPICPAAGRGGRAGWTAGCDVTVPSLGVQNASRILMRIPTWYAPSNTQWGDLADLGKLAAFGLCKNCDLRLCPATNSALVEQMAVNDAFEAIGFRGDEVYRKCPPCPIVPPQP